MSLIAALVLALAVLTGGTAATVYAADQAVPGDALYAVDLTVEQIQLALARDPATKAQLHLRFAEERVAEIQALALQGNTTAVAEAAQNLEQHLTAAQELLQQAPAPEVAQQMSTVMEEAQAVLEHPVPGAPTQPTPTGTPEPEPSGTPEPHGTPGAYVEFTGVVESMDSDQWVVDGQTIAIDATTQIEPGIQVGDTVKVKAFPATGGSLVAYEIEQADHAGGSDDNGDGQHDGQKVEITGTVESMDGNQWVVNGQTITVDANTEIDAGIQVGDTVKVEAYVQADGSLLATEIHAVSQADMEGEDHGGTDDGGQDDGNTGDHDGSGSGQDDGGNGGGQDDGGNGGGQDDGGNGGGQDDGGNGGGQDDGGSSGQDDGGSSGGHDDNGNGSGQDDDDNHDD